MKKHLFFIFIFCIFINIFITANAATSGYYKYEVLSDGTAKIVGFNDDTITSGITVPSTLDGYKVTVIGEYAFNGTNVSSITLPNTVTTLENYAFSAANGLSRIYFSNSIKTIGYNILTPCSNYPIISIPEDNPYFTTDNGVVYNKDKTVLVVAYSPYVDTFILPDTVKTIRPYAFADRYGISELKIPASVTEISDNSFLGLIEKFTVDENNPYFSSADGVLFNKDKTTLISYPGASENSSYTIPSTVETIKKYAFYYNLYLSELTVPPSLKSVGDYAFYLYNPYELDTRPLKVNISDLDAWMNIKFESGSANPISSKGLYLNGELLTSVTISNDVDGTYTFANCSTITDVTLEEGVTCINEGMFERCNITSLTLPKSLYIIGEYAFRYGYFGTELTIPDNVRFIENYAFNGCYYITSIHLGAKLRHIGDQAFSPGNYTSRLTTVSMHNKVQTIGEYVFSVHSSLTLTYFGTPEQYASINIGSNNGTLLNYTTVEYERLTSAPAPPSIEATASKNGDTFTVNATFSNISGGNVIVAGYSDNRLVDIICEKYRSETDNYTLTGSFDMIKVFVLYLNTLEPECDAKEITTFN